MAIVGPNGDVAFVNTAMKALLPALEPGAALASGRPRGPSRAACWSSRPSPCGRRAGRSSPTCPAPSGEAGSQQQLMAHPDRRSGARLRRRDAGGAQRRRPVAAADDAAVLAQAVVAQPAARRRGARGQEPAQRDDHPSRVAAAEAGTAGALAVRRGGAVPAAARPPPADGAHEPRVDHRRGDPPARPGRAGFPAVQPSGGTAARARRRSPRCCRTSSTSCEPQAEQQGIAVEMEAHRGVAIQVDRAMVRQALLNLALNAIDAMPSGGTLSLRARSVEDQQVQIDVVDSGVGIKPEHLGGSSTCTSRRANRAVAWASRWSTAPCSCTTAPSRSNPRPVAARRSGLRLPRA